MADGDDFVAGADADRQQRKVQRGRAARDGAGVRRADGGGELTLEGGDLGALRDPAGQNRAAGGVGLALVEPGACDGDTAAAEFTS